MKWTGLPYSECTWENADMLRRLAPGLIAQFDAKARLLKLPVKLPTNYRRRLKFTPLATQPDFLGGQQAKSEEERELKLRDYQLAGVNWMLRSYTK